MTRTCRSIWTLLGAVALMLSAVLVPSTAEAQSLVRLNEAQSSNQGTVVDLAGNTPDWIELYNPTTSAVDLTGWSLSDSAASPRKWLFPAGTTIASDATLLVFASGTGISANGELHTNFKLASAGEYLGLYDTGGSLVSSFDPIPALPGGFSWGVGSAGGLSLFDLPTPNAPNGAGSAGLLDDVSVAPERGFYTAPISVTLTAEADTQIRYTLDGTAPSAGVGELYTGPVPISQTTVLRAVATRAGWTSPKPVTSTYLFAADIPDQPAMQPLPAGADRGTIIAALNELPVISLTSTNDDNTPRFTWSQVDDAPVAVEMIHPDGTSGFQVDAGAHEVGGHSVRYEKDSLRLVFKSEFGESELDYPVFAGADNPASPAATSFKRLTLRMGAHDTGLWDHPDTPTRSSMIRAAWHDDTMLDLGHEGINTRYVNVMLNGQYWGLYLLREHPDDHFMASYFGGDNEQYLGINRGAVSAGAGTSWDALVAASGSWGAFSQIVDPINYIDFMLVSEFAGNQWDLRVNHNWRGAGPATAGADGPGYQFFHSDPDISMISVDADILTPSFEGRPVFSGPAESWTKLKAEADADFLALVAERADHLFFDDGVLSPAAAAQRWDRLAAQIELPIRADWARWNVLDPSIWQSSMDWFGSVYFPNRTNRTASIMNERGHLPMNHLGQAGIATQSSVCCGGDAGRAIDGRVDGDWAVGSTTATASQLEPWWQVDLGAVQAIDAIRVWNRYGCCQDRLSNFHVFVSDAPFTADSVAGTQVQPGVSDFRFDGTAGHHEDFEIGRSGRYVRIQLAGTNILSLAEVQIFEGEPNEAPTVITPGNQSSMVGDVASLTISATDPEGQTLAWTATGLPAGISIDPTTGQISGTVREAGTFAVDVTVTDPSGASASTSFSWTAAYPAPSRMILNEWNAVDKDLFLKNDGSDSTLGRVVGNGGDWFELVVIEDHLDIRGWSFELSDNDNDAGVQEVTDVFTLRNRNKLSDLRAGTIITISEDFRDDISYDPEGGDWHINLQANSLDAGRFFTAESQSNFSVNNNDWQLIIRDATGNPVFGPAGEGPGASGVSDEEIGELEADPTGAISPTAAYDDGDGSTFGEPNGFDGRLQDFDALRPVLDDTVEPDSIVLAPAHNDAVDGPSVVISGTASDNVGVAKMAVALRNVDTGQWLRRDGTFGAFQFVDAVVDSPGAPTTTWTFSTTLADGPWAVVARAEDTSGNRDSTRSQVAFDVSSVGVDAIAPDTTITTPGDKETLNDGSVAVTGQATDNVGVTAVEITVKNRDTGEWLRNDGSFGAFEWLTTTVDNPGQVSTGWASDLDLPDGRWAIVARAADAAGNTDSSRARVQFTVETAVADIVEPDTTISAPTARQEFPDGAIELIGTSTDNVGVTRVRVTVQDLTTKLWLQPDGSFGSFALLEATVANPDAAASGWSYAIDVAAGEYAVTARAVDAAGNTDSTRPRVRFSVS